MQKLKWTQKLNDLFNNKRKVVYEVIELSKVVLKVVFVSFLVSRSSLVMFCFHAMFFLVSLIVLK